MLTIDDKLTYIQSNCMAQAYCAGCRLVLEKTCPKKLWKDWTPEEIETAFNIIYGGEVDDGEK